jgi:hypothetical protein
MISATAGIRSHASYWIKNCFSTRKINPEKKRISGNKEW